jgi:hypothetical protein
MHTGGVFAEAVLGRFNSAEKLDLTRFWNWQDSPIPDSGPQIAPLQAGSRAQDVSATPGRLDQPIVNIVPSTSLPDPTGLSAAFSAISQANMFRDMSGVGQLLDQAAASMKTAADLASSTGGQASENFKTSAKMAEEAAKQASGMFKAMLGAQAALGKSDAAGKKPSLGTMTPSSFGALANRLAEKEGAGGTAAASRTAVGQTGGGSSRKTSAASSGEGDGGASRSQVTEDDLYSSTLGFTGSREETSGETLIGREEAVVEPYRRARDVDVGLENLARNLRNLPDQALDYLDITRSDLNHFAAEYEVHPFDELLRHAQQYWAKHDEYVEHGNEVALGKLHERIDWVYSRLVGFESTFAPVDIPLEEYRIRESYGGVADHWFAAAGLVFRAEELAETRNIEEEMREGVIERWNTWLQEHTPEGPLPELGEQTMRLNFVRNVLTNWNAFTRSWDNFTDHDLDIFIRGHEMAVYATNETPIPLYEAAKREFNPWISPGKMADVNMMEYFSGAVCWMKIGFRDTLERHLDEAYGVGEWPISIVNC